ncbi:MAG: beta-galactosidase [Acidobacteriaceae bacterium]|nr:beta-galactosidase [Acidobacteriaceae bacterium]
MFSTFIQAGFECATHRNAHGRRLDIVGSTRHDELVQADFARLGAVGIGTVREGARWHLIETEPGRYDFSSLDRIYDAAEEAGIEVILDLMHFGWPDFLDVFSPRFIDAFERFAFATACFLKQRLLSNARKTGAGASESRTTPQTSCALGAPSTSNAHNGTQRLCAWNQQDCFRVSRRASAPFALAGRCFVVPINEISFLSWAGGDQALLNPHQRQRGGELKRQLVRAAIAASRVLRQELPSVRLVSAEPVIHIVGRPAVPGDALAAEAHRLAMYEATDMLTGRCCPELGGSAEYLDVVGVNFYDRNQWVHHSHTLTHEDPRYRPFRQILREVWERYRKPVLVSETGTEDDARPQWFDYVSAEIQAAMACGIPVKGVCLYPILNHPGWDDDRHCRNGLWDYANHLGDREIYQRLADAIARQQAAFDDELRRVA